MVGTLDMLSLVDLFQLLVPTGRSGRLLVDHPSGEAAVFLSEGRIVHAEFANLTGRNALATLFADGRGNYRFTDGMIAPRVSINESAESLLLDMIRLAERSSRDVLETYMGDAVPSVTINREVADQLVLSADALAFLRHVDGKRPVNEVASLAELTSTEARQIISQLLYENVLSIAERRPRTARLVARVKRDHLDAGTVVIDQAILASWESALGYQPDGVACRTASSWSGTFAVTSQRGAGPYVYFARDTLLRENLAADTAMLVKPVPRRSKRN